MISSTSPSPLSSPLSQAAKKMGGVSGKDDFLQLFTAQLQNQDPLSPVDTKDMAVQLAQFTQVEQLVRMNEGLEGVRSALGDNLYGTSSAVATSLIERSVWSAGNSLSLGHQGGAEVRFSLPANAENAVLKIYNASGTEVAQQDLGRLAKGETSIQWDGAGLPAGQYTFQVKALAKDESELQVQSYTSMKVKSVKFGSGGILLVGADGRQISLGEVAAVED